MGQIIMGQIIMADAGGEWRKLFAGPEYDYIRTSQLAPTRAEDGKLHFLDRDLRQAAIEEGRIRPEDALEW